MLNIILFFHCFTNIYIYRDGAELMQSSNPVHACHDQSKNISFQIVKILEFEVKGAYASFPNPRTYGFENILKIRIDSSELKQIREDLTGKKTPPNRKFFFIIGAVRKIKQKRNLGMKKDTPYQYPPMNKDGKDEKL